MWRRAYLASEVGDCGQTDRVEEVVAGVEGDVEQGQSGCDAQPEQHGATEERGSVDVLCVSRFCFRSRLTYVCPEPVLVNMSRVFRKETEAEKGERACFYARLDHVHRYFSRAEAPLDEVGLLRHRSGGEVEHT